MAKMKSFWNNLPQPFFALAPMEAVTDVVFRHVVQRAGAPDVFFTEFANAAGWVHAQTSQLPLFMPLKPPDYPSASRRGSATRTSMNGASGYEHY